MNTAAHILAIDLGTTNFKAALFDERGRLLALSRAASPVVASNGRAEMPVDAFHAALVDLIADLSNRAELASVRGISFSSQANSFALFDGANRPITPIILWTDDRARGGDEPLNRIADLHVTSGVPHVDHEFAQAKLRWIAAHDPATAQRARKISFISDLLVEWMTGRHASELGLACLTALATHTESRWDPARLGLLGLPSMQWPSLVRPATDVGPILPDVADRLRLPRSARLFMGCLDQYAGAIGTGAVLPGSVCETTGTVLAAVACRHSGTPPPGPSVYVGPSFATDRVFHMTFSSTSANLLEWYRTKFAASASFDELIRLAASEPGCAKLGAIRSSVGDAFDEDVLRHRPGEIVNGIMHRVCEELGRLLEELKVTGSPVRSAGGGARSDAWLQMKADHLGVPIQAASTEEPTCRGAAMLAANGLGIGSIDELSATWCPSRATFLK